MYHYVYILKSLKQDIIYVGYTTNLKQRVDSHNNSNSSDHFTFRNRPWKLVYYESYLDENDAREREGKLKNYGKGLSLLKNRITRSLRCAGNRQTR